MPQLWIVGGPNGAGKTTLADRWLASRIPVVSPDALAATRKISPMQAGRAALLEQERLLKDGKSFALDTTFSGNRELALMQRAGESGYKVNLIFVCVDAPEVCLSRVLERVKLGGHDVPDEDVMRRYVRSLSNLTSAFDLADRILVLDNSGERRRLVFSYEQGRIKHMSPNLPDWTQNAIPRDILKSRSKGLGQ